MSSEYEYIYLSSRKGQIEALERDYSSLKKDIRKAYDLVMGEKEKIEKNDPYADIIISIANEFNRLKKTEDINFDPPEESYITSRELIKEILPQIRKLRQELFKTKDPPFPLYKSKNNWNISIEWLKKEAEKEFLQWKSKVGEKIGTAEKLESERKKLEKDIHCILTKLSRITPGKIIPPKYKAILLPCPGEKGWESHISVISGRRLEKLEKATKKISEKTNFQQTSLVMFILTGITPLYIPYQESVTIKGNKKTFKLEINRPLTQKEIDKLFVRIKKEFGMGKKAFIDDKRLVFLYEALESEGGIPQKDKREFWERIAKGCNKRYSEWFKGENAANSARITYNRLMKRIHRIQKTDCQQ